jgi:hypothetical protein
LASGQKNDFTGKMSLSVIAAISVVGSETVGGEKTYECNLENKIKQRVAQQGRRTKEDSHKKIMA